MMKKNNKRVIEASLLSFPREQNQLEKQLMRLKSAKINSIHYDVMDNIFVNNTSFGTEWLNLLFINNFDVYVHFMVKRPRKWINMFINYPSKAIVFHPEPILKFFSWYLLKKIKRSGRLVGLAFKPNTDISKYHKLLKICDLVTIMGVEPGFGGQKFLGEKIIKNLKYINDIKKSTNKCLIIQLDGGVNFDVIKQTYKYVDHFISGSFLIKQKNINNFKKFIDNLD